MIESLYKSWWAWVLCGLMACGPAVAVRAQEEGLRAAADLAQLATEVDGEDLLQLAADAVEAIKAAPEGEYWLGIGIGRTPPPDGAEHGIVVEDVFDDSPAAKAEIKQHDILIKAGDIELKQPADLVKAVDAAKENELTITLVREGEKLTVKVTPARRPKTERVIEAWRSLRGATPELRDEIKRLEEALKDLKNKAGGEKFDFWLARPGMVAPHRFEYQVRPMPKNLSIWITKEGDQPTKIRVKRDDKEWEVTDDKLNELPEDIRGHLRRMLSRSAAFNTQLPHPPATKTLRVRPDGKVEGELKIAPVPPTPHIARLHTFGESGVDKKLDEIMKEIKQLRKDMDDLRAKSGETTKR